MKLTFIFHVIGLLTCFQPSYPQTDPPTALPATILADSRLDTVQARAIRHNVLFEWFDVQTGEPKGSKDLRGEAGVLYDVITSLTQ